MVIPKEELDKTSKEETIEMLDEDETQADFGGNRQVDSGGNRQVDSGGNQDQVIN
jgi:hypothetical protein